MQSEGTSDVFDLTVPDLHNFAIEGGYFVHNCDPVQGDSYEIDGIKVASFVGPRWFRGGAGPWDFLGKLSAPMTMSPGGYLIFSDGTQTFGERFPEHKRNLVATIGRRARARALRDDYAVEVAQAAAP